MNKHIVVDTRSDFAIGTILDQMSIHKAMDRGTILPYDDSGEDFTGSACWTRRDFGIGRKVDAQTARVHCPTTIFLRADAPRIHYAVAFAPTQGQEGLAVANGAQGFPGRLILAAAPTSSNGNVARLTAVTQAIQTQEMGKYTPGEDWIVVGESRANIQHDGYYELGLYGSAHGLSVKWLALSTSS